MQGWGGGGGLTQEANTVYISIMNQEREKERAREKEGRVDGRKEWRKPFSLCRFPPLSAANPRGASSLFSAFAFFFSPLVALPPLLNLIRELLPGSAH